MQEPPDPRPGQHLPAPPLPTPLWSVELLRLAPLPRRSSLLPVGSAGALHLVEEKRRLLCHVNAPCSHGLVPAFPHHQLASVPTHPGLAVLQMPGTNLSPVSGHTFHCPPLLHVAVWPSLLFSLSTLSTNTSLMCPMVMPADHRRPALVCLQTPLRHPANDKRPPLATELTCFLGSSSQEMAPRSTLLFRAETQLLLHSPLFPAPTAMQARSPTHGTS